MLRGQHGLCRMFRQLSSMSKNTRVFGAHDATVEQIAASIKYFYDRKEKFRINHGSTNSTRLAGKGHNIVDTSQLSNVLEVDKEKKTVLVEPNVPMDRLVEATLKHGLIPPVVMEFPGITVGGGYAGTSGESSSFKHGYFNRTINWVEMIMADGEKVKCSNTEKADLFHGAAGAVGSLGVTTLVELQLREAKRFVETTYHPTTSIKDAISKLRTFTADPSYDYIDGILFSKTCGAIITGRLTDTPPANAKIQRFSSPKDPWFYLHVESLITSSPSIPITEAVPLAEYLFRYDRGGFWVGASGFQYFHFPFTALTRRWLDDFLHTRMMYTALHASRQSHRYIVQDLALPYDTAEEFIEYTAERFGIWPLWLCPLLTQRKPPGFHPRARSSSSTADTTTDGGPTEKKEEKEVEEENESEILNIGLWGRTPPSSSSSRAAHKALNRDLESTLHRLGGMKWLYAETFYTPSEFWDAYGGKETETWYSALREKYKAQGLASVYDKVGPVDRRLRREEKGEVEGKGKERGEGTGWKERVLDVWPLGGVWGMWKAVRSGSYKEARRAGWKDYCVRQKCI